MVGRHPFLAAASALLAISCSATDANTIDVYAASSLTDAFSELEEQFEADHPDVDIRLNLAGSNALQRQILDGADAHIFAPADVELFEPLLDDATGEPTLYATNRLTLVIPADGEQRVLQPADLEQADTLLARCAAGVPCGDATDTYLDEAGLVAARSTDEPNVRSVLTKVASGEVDAGFVYVSDVVASDAVIEIPLANAPTVSYGVLLISPEPGAERFADFVTSPKAATILQKLGFTVP